MSNPIPKEGAWMEKQFMHKTSETALSVVTPSVVTPSVVMPSEVVVVSSVVMPSEVVVVSSVVVPTVVVVITGVLHSDPVNPGAHSNPSLTFTDMSPILIEPVLVNIPRFSDDCVPSGASNAVLLTPILVAVISSPILGFDAGYSGLRLSAPGPRFSV